MVCIFIPVYLFIIPSYTPRPTESFLSKIQTIDWVGSVLSCGAFVAGIIAINFGGTLYPWHSWQIIVLFVVSGVLFIALFLQQHFNFLTTQALRVLPIHLLKTKDMIICFVCQGKDILDIFLRQSLTPLSCRCAYSTCSAILHPDFLSISQGILRILIFNLASFH